MTHSADLPRPLLRTREVSVFANAYGELFNDEIRSPSGAPGRYLRWRWNGRGVIAVPLCGDRLAFVPTYRYPVAAVSMEFPRGMAEPGEPIDRAAKRELLEETGLHAEHAELLGTVHPDTGLIESGVAVALVRVPRRTGTRAALEVMESNSEPTWLARTEILAAIATGEITCGLTLSALALWWARGTPA